MGQNPGRRHDGESMHAHCFGVAQVELLPHADFMLWHAYQIWKAHVHKLIQLLEPCLLGPLKNALAMECFRQNLWQQESTSWEHLTFQSETSGELSVCHVIIWMLASVGQRWLQECKGNSRTIHTVLYAYSQLLKPMRLSNNCIIIKANYIFYSRSYH